MHACLRYSLKRVYVVVDIYSLAARPNLLGIVIWEGNDGSAKLGEFEGHLSSIHCAVQCRVGELEWGRWKL